jgi:cell division protein FtsW (lipid II flippase)
MSRSIQGNLLKIAGAFLLLQTIIITLSPAVRERSWDVSLVRAQWIALIVWGVFSFLAHASFKKYLPDADPYLFPVAALLSGWGILTIWRLQSGFGARQLTWFAVSMIVFLAGMRLTSLKFLQRYKYLLLVGGLILTACTLIFGTNPGGSGPRLWLGCCDVYFQPSEPLKLLLIVYLAAYFSDKLPFRLRTMHFLYPTLILSGIVIMLLMAQRDLGTASIFLALYMILIYLATNNKNIPFISILMLIGMGFAGYYFVNVVHARIDSWLNPWADSGGKSYQIIQSLIAIANGGIEGRGYGVGNPGLVPVAISDFIYSAIAEETGLFGTLSLLALFGILITRGLRAALRAPDLFRRFLAAGISAYFGVQAILIIGGNLALLPLTGVTLPFVSYGGSSLLTSFIAVLLLLIISNHGDEEPAPIENPSPYIMLNTLLLAGLFVSALATGWWSVVRAPDLLARKDNLRLIIEEKYVPRGAILDRSNSPITVTTGETGTFVRKYIYPDLAPVTGYADLNYGQAGLEAILNGYLRGVEGNPSSTVWLNHLLYGTTPPGLDVRLSIDLNLQSFADKLMTGRRGAVVMLNAETGEILVMASHPTFDPNHLDENAANLLSDPQKPLINRATLGNYPTGSIMEPFAQALYGNTNINLDQRLDVYKAFGFNKSPELKMEVSPPSSNDMAQLHASPLQMALASASLSYKGVVPAPRIVMAVNTPRDGWVVLPAEGTPLEATQPSASNDAALSLIKDGNNYWSYIGEAQSDESSVTWLIGGTPPDWQATPLAIVVVLEENNREEAQRIGQSLLLHAMTP